MKLINADRVVHWQSYDDEHETFPDHEGTIADFLDQMTDEGCPESVDAVPVVRCKYCEHHECYGGNIILFCYRHGMMVAPDYYCGDGNDGEGK